MRNESSEPTRTKALSMNIGADYSSLKGVVFDPRTGVALHPLLDWDDEKGEPRFAKTHINIYTGGKSRLGRLATNHSNVTINHPLFGAFRTLEGLWYWLRAGKFDAPDWLRVVSGAQARKEGKLLPVVFNDHFQREFKMGIVAKLNESYELRKLLKESTLPLVHYYYYAGKDVDDVTIRQPKGHEWQMIFWEEMRVLLKANKALPDEIDD